MDVLGGVDEEEEECEGPGRDRRRIERQCLDAPQQCGEVGRSRLTMTSRSAGLPKFLDDGERLVAFEAPDDAA
jgi:hypothetical protein